MCDCVKRIKENMKNKFKETEKDFKEVTNVSFENEGFLFGETKLMSTLYEPLVIEYTIETKKGKIQNKKKLYSMTHSYCPFCGEKKEK